MKESFLVTRQEDPESSPQKSEDNLLKDLLKFRSFESVRKELVPNSFSPKCKLVDLILEQMKKTNPEYFVKTAEKKEEVLEDAIEMIAEKMEEADQAAPVGWERVNDRDRSGYIKGEVKDLVEDNPEEIKIFRRIFIDPPREYHSNLPISYYAKKDHQSEERLQFLDFVQKNARESDRWIGSKDNATQKKIQDMYKELSNPDFNNYGLRTEYLQYYSPAIIDRAKKLIESRTFITNKDNWFTKYQVSQKLKISREKLDTFIAEYQKKEPDYFVYQQNKNKGMNLYLYKELVEEIAERVKGGEKQIIPEGWKTLPQMAVTLKEKFPSLRTVEIGRIMFFLISTIQENEELNEIYKDALYIYESKGTSNETNIQGLYIRPEETKKRDYYFSSEFQHSLEKS